MATHVSSSRALSVAGTTLWVLGAVHVLATLGGGGATAVEMVQAGWWRAADVTIADPMWVAVFWSLQFGAMLGLMGWALRRLARAGAGVGRPWCVAFGVVCLVGGVAVPVGGFWIGLGLAVWLWLAQPSDSTAGLRTMP